jgi:hypothetical protein
MELFRCGRPPKNLPAKLAFFAELAASNLSAAELPLEMGESL